MIGYIGTSKDSTSSDVAAYTSDYDIQPSDTGKIFTNDGAEGIVTFSLPPAVPGLSYTFFVEDPDGLKIQAADGDSIRIIAVLGDLVTSTSIGAFVTLECVNAGKWRSISAGGTWS